MMHEVGLLRPVLVFFLVFTVIAALSSDSGKSDAVFQLTIGAVLFWVCVRDWVSFEIPDLASQLLAAATIAWLIFDPSPRMAPHVTAGFGLSILFWLIGEAYFKITGVDGLGLGDAKLAFGGGMLVGPVGVAPAVLIAACAGLIWLMMRKIFAGVSARDPVPFGPFLCLGFWTVWLNPLVTIRWMLH